MTPEYFNFIGYDISIGYLVIRKTKAIYTHTYHTPSMLLFPPQLTMSHGSICTVFYLFSTAVFVTAACPTIP